MVLRTPRRRISPQTKLKYRAIKNFFNKTLGNQSQSDIKTYSNETITNESISLKLDNFKENNVNETAYSDKNYADKPEGDEIRDNQYFVKEEADVADHKSKFFNTEILYKKSDINYKRSDGSADESKQYNTGEVEMNRSGPTKYEKMNNPSIFSRKRLSGERNPYSETFDCSKRNDNWSLHSTNSYSSFIGKQFPRTQDQKIQKVRHKRDCSPILQTKETERTHRRKHRSSSRNHEDKVSRHHKVKENNINVDQDFINEIIRRQYKPVKLFGRKDSEVSQISAPVCRDQEYMLNENIQEGDLCSCGNNRNKPKYSCYNDMSDMRSVCDTRLYSSAKNNRPKRRKQHTDLYNDSMYYDLVPVKEKQSPKSRRKCAEDALMYYEKYREVPPSPRTLRPQLNLASHNVYENLNDTIYKKVHSPNRRKRLEVYRDMQESEYNIDVPKLRKKHSRKVQNSYDNLHLKCSNYEAKTVPVNCSNADLQNSHNLVSEDKADTALCEIKNILQTFLQEIKKDSVVLETEKSDCMQSNGPKQKAYAFYPNLSDNSNINCNNINSNQQSDVHPSIFMPPFMNPCCYPVLPMCPINCMQNSYVLPTPSTCQTCANVMKDTISKDEVLVNKTEKAKSTDNNETDTLIKEIYKFVAQKSFLDREERKIKDDHAESSKLEAKVFTTRSVGSCRRVTKQNAKTGTPQLRCYSKSCEALVTYMAANEDNTETTNYSDTLFTKTSRDATPFTDSNFSSSIPQKNKDSKFKNVLQSFRFLKKKKRDAIEELSESNSTTEISDLHNKKPPFKQNLTNYMMHQQQFFHPPPRPVPHCSHQRNTKYDPENVPYSQRRPGYGNPTCGDGYYMQPNHHHYNDRQAQGHGRHHEPYHPSYLPYSTSYDPFYHQVPPQVPLCLKEIEVKSTATQSERKFKFFNRFSSKSPTRKIPDRSYGRIRNYSTQTATPIRLEPTKTGPSFWRSWQEKALADHYRMDADKFQKSTQKQLAEGDLKIKNAMIKNLFYKRNPFSPNNLIIKTLLGRDKSSYGNPPKLNTKTTMFV